MEKRYGEEFFIRIKKKKNDFYVALLPQSQHWTSSFNAVLLLKQHGDGGVTRWFFTMVLHFRYTIYMKNYNEQFYLLIGNESAIEYLRTNHLNEAEWFLVSSDDSYVKVS